MLDKANYFIFLPIPKLNAITRFIKEIFLLFEALNKTTSFSVENLWDRSPMENKEELILSRTKKTNYIENLRRINSEPQKSDISM